MVRKAVKFSDAKAPKVDDPYESDKPPVTSSGKYKVTTGRAVPKSKSSPPADPSTAKASTPYARVAEQLTADATREAHKAVKAGIVAASKAQAEALYSIDNTLATVVDAISELTETLRQLRVTHRVNLAEDSGVVASAERPVEEFGGPVSVYRTQGPDGAFGWYMAAQGMPVEDHAKLDATTQEEALTEASALAGRPEGTISVITLGADSAAAADDELRVIPEPVADNNGGLPENPGSDPMASGEQADDADFAEEPQEEPAAE